MNQQLAFVARLAGVSHRYASTVAIEAVDLEIPAGRMVGFIGPDGVGKSSLLGLISGSRRIQAGTVEVLGADMADARHRSAVCPRIAYMPQGLGRNLYPDLSVSENIDFFGRLFGQPRDERRRRIIDLLTSTGLAPFPDRHAVNLSGGMKQKLGLCCALIHDPDLLILDEPTTGVDPLSRRQFWDLIDRMQKRRKGMSVLVATAYMDEAERFDWLVMMDEGRILATGAPEELKSRTGADDLEEAYIALLPEKKRRDHRTLSIPPRKIQADGPAIEAHNLTRRFGDFTAVDHVSFHIERGEIFGFIGPNGCGKTTTMKMLTGLLPPTEGECRIFGRGVHVGGMEIRQRIGYMSQSFSLYTELTVRQNLELHVRLFHLPEDKIDERVAALVKSFGLGKYLDDEAAELPLGIRQRLSLAVAVIHEPEILILDEPTSGVDPVARDGFWELLIDLSRNQGVTIFVSTHFMNEGERCDRIALMNAGRVLACDAPKALIRARRAKTLEDAFIEYIEDDQRRGRVAFDSQGTRDVSLEPTTSPRSSSQVPQRTMPLDLQRLWAYARREAIELSRDRIRLVFCFLVPLLLLVIFGYGISMDVENLSYAVLDRDQTPESRTYLEGFSGSRYFEERSPVASDAELDRRLRSGELKLAIEIPPEFGKDLKSNRRPQVGIWIDGSNTFRAETTRGYVSGVHLNYVGDLSRRTLGTWPTLVPIDIEMRFRYNQDMESVFAIVPGIIALLLALIPTVLTAVGVVREKEMGSITNLYVTPVTRLEFLLGKQLPYVCVSLIDFVALVAFTIVLFGVPLKGSFLALALGALLFVTATTGFGLLISAFTKTQIAALFAALILTMLPSMMFSGLIRPVSSLTGGAAVMGKLFPSAHFHKISVGTFTKALGFGDLLPNYAALGAFVAAFLVLSLVLLRKQEV
jgi:ribosome-dependent ATPase